MKNDCNNEHYSQLLFISDKNNLSCFLEHLYLIYMKYLGPRYLVPIYKYAPTMHNKMAEYPIKLYTSTTIYIFVVRSFCKKNSKYSNFYICLNIDNNMLDS